MNEDDVGIHEKDDDKSGSEIDDGENDYSDDYLKHS